VAGIVDLRLPIRKALETLAWELFGYLASSLAWFLHGNAL
jgi:hypothetical protein